VTATPFLRNPLGLINKVSVFGLEVLITFAELLSHVHLDGFLLVKIGGLA
jgi:hypothetical protein